MSESLIGKVLATPETGWKRCYNNATFIYSGFSSGSDSNFSSGIDYYTSTTANNYVTSGATVTINFTGTKLRVISLLSNTSEESKPYVVSVFIDGQYCGQLYDKLLTTWQYKTVTFENTDLDEGLHTLLLKVESTSYRFWFDSIDIGEDETVSTYSSTTLNQVLWDKFADNNTPLYTALKDDTSTVIGCKYSYNNKTSIGTFHDYSFGTTARDYCAQTPTYTEYKLGEQFEIYSNISPAHTELFELTKNGLEIKFNAILSDGEEVDPADYKGIIEIDEHNRSMVCIPQDIVLKSKSVIDTKVLEHFMYADIYASQSDMYVKVLLSPDNKTFYYYNKKYQAWYPAEIEEILDDNKCMTIDQLKELTSTMIADFPGDYKNLAFVLRIGIKQPTDIDSFDYMASYNVDKIRFVFSEDTVKQNYPYKTVDMNLFYAYTGDSSTKKNAMRYLIGDQILQSGTAYSIMISNSLVGGDGLEFTYTDYEVQAHLRLITAESDSADTSYIFADTDKYNVNDNLVTTTYSWTDVTAVDTDNAFVISDEENQSYIDKDMTTSTDVTNIGFRPKFAIDINFKIYHRNDSEPYLPIVTSLKDIKPGECIACTYKASSNTVGKFTIGTNGKKIIPDYSSVTPDGYFYFICVGTDASGATKLVADRNIQKGISWEVLNSSDLCVTSGMDLTLAGRTCHMRLFNTTSAATAGIYDLNEWDAIISYYNINGVTPSASETWNAASMYSWTMTTPQGDMANRIVRGYQDYDTIAETYTQTNYVSTTVSNDIGFRPILTVEPDRDDGPTYPECTLELATSIGNCQPGQAIACEYKAESGKVGTFIFNYNSEKELISDPAPAAPNGKFYFVCVGYTAGGNKKFVADRNIQTSISWETLNSSDICVTSGQDISSMTKIEGSLVRLMQSDVTNYDMDLTSSEWDAIMMQETIGASGISAEGCNYWNMEKSSSWMLNTPHDKNFAGNASTMSDRVIRGKENRNYTTQPSTFADSQTVSSALGYRPVLEVSMRYTTILLNTEIDTTHVYEKNTNNTTINVECSFDFVADKYQLADTTFQVLIETTLMDDLFTSGTLTPDSKSFSFSFDLTKLVYGDNTLHIVGTTTDPDTGDIVKNDFKFIINREEPKQTSKTRNFLEYTGGFNFGTLSKEDSKLVNNTRISIDNAPKEVKIPSNTIKISLTEG